MLPADAKPLQLSNSSKPNIMTSSANVANVMTPIIKFTAPVGTELIVPSSNTNDQTGAETRGAYMVFDLRDNAGNKLPQNTDIELSRQNPGQESKEIIRTVQHGVWGVLDSTQQHDANYKQRLMDAMAFDGKYGLGLRVLEQGVLTISVSSSAVVDWSKSTLEIYAGSRKAVK